MLSPYRVLDCTDDRGNLAGFILAQLGADVILVEPPHGSGARRRSPYAGSRCDPDAALWHWAFNRGKRSVVLDLASDEGKQRLTDLASDADVLLWSGRPSHMPFDHDVLRSRNPGLVVVALTPFGLDGPKANWHDSDIVISAASCQLALTGDEDRPPLQMGSPQGFLHGAVDAAVAAVLGLVARAKTGRGQLADVSAQASCVQAAFCYSLNEAWQAVAVGRAGGGVNMGGRGGYTLRWTYPAADGEVSITLMFGSAMAHFTGNLFHWIWEEGFCDEATRDKPWADLWLQLASGEEPASELDRLVGIIGAFTATKTKAELMDQARGRGVLLAPIATLSEVLDNDHLAARGFWDVVPGTRDRTEYRMPGRFVVAPNNPLRRLPAAARLGADTDGVLREGWSTHTDGQSRNAEKPWPADDLQIKNIAVLEGVKVLDLTWSIAGPLTGRTLADFGATVVKVESRNRPDLGRTCSPFHPLESQYPLEGSGLFADVNAGKLGIELDITNPAGRETLLDLVRWADVVLESFSAGTMDRLGLGYEQLAAVNPEIIMLSSSLAGQTGTLELPGFGNLTTALFGFTATTKWPDRPAAGPFGAYTDAVAPRFALAAILAALDHRRRTGGGQYLDLSQAEAALHLLAPALLDTEVNKREFVALGNAHPDLAPHGVYPTAGEDRWVAIVCTNDDAWQELAKHIGRPDIAELTRAQRLARRDELDDVIGSWTTDRDPEALQCELQSIGVAAHQVQNTHECLADPQLAHRRHYVTVPHPLLGDVIVQGPRFLLSATPGRTLAAGPTYGQDAHRILSEFLGYSDEQITELVIAEALG